MTVKVDAYAMLRDEKSANTAGGAGTTGSFQTRTLNTESFDPDGIVSLSSNQFTLAAGTYFVKARAPFYSCARTLLKIRNVTDSTDAVIGQPIFVTDTPSETGAIDEKIAHLAGRFTIAGTKAFELQYRIGTNNGGDTSVLGIAANYGVTEVYAEVEIWRVVESLTDQKISDLSAVTTLAGTEEFVLGASGVSKKITAANLGLSLSGEISYDQITADVTVSATTEASPTDVITASAHTFSGSQIVYVEFFAPVLAPGASSALILNLWDASTDLGRIAVAANANVPCLVRRRLTPSAGSHTYKVRGWRDVANGTVFASSPRVPAYLRIVGA